MTPTRHRILRADRSGSGGFTMVEMLVVLVIISVLLAVSFVTYGSYKRHKMAGTIKSQVRYAADAVESCAAGETLSTYSNCGAKAVVAADQSLKHLVDETIDDSGGITGGNSGADPVLDPETASRACTPPPGKICVVAKGRSYAVVGSTIGAGDEETYFALNRRGGGKVVRTCGASGIGVDQSAPATLGGTPAGGSSAKGTQGTGGSGITDPNQETSVTTKMCPTGRW